MMMTLDIEERRKKHKLEEIKILPSTTFKSSAASKITMTSVEGRTFTFRSWINFIFATICQSVSRYAAHRKTEAMKGRPKA